MSIQDDQTARVMAPETEVGTTEATVMADDMRAILRLIATQLEDSDRRQSEVLGDMHRRLAEMGNDARLTRAQVPAAFATAFEHIEEGIEKLARLVAAAELQQPASPVGKSSPAGQSGSGLMFVTADPDSQIGAKSEDDQDWSAAADKAAQRELQPHSEPSDEFLVHSEAAEPEPSADDMMITDNAADRFDLYDDAKPAEPYREPADAARSGHALHPGQATRIEPPMFASAASGNDAASREDRDWDEVSSWDREQAEALTRVYEAHHASDTDRSAQSAPHGLSPVAGIATPTTAKQDLQSPAPVVHASVIQLHKGSQPGIANIAPVIEQGWLEERFAEIAAKIEESIFELRDDQALLSLSDRFGEFEERVGLALEDVAARHDVDALKSAEAQIDSMVSYFERVEAQLGRIDSLEGQMETLLDRLSDDNLMQLFAGHGGSAEIDYSGAAQAAAENVAQRFLAEFANGAIGGHGDGQAVDDMREALEAFMTERRERDDEAAGMLDTIQQALIRVLDRVEVLEAGYDNPPMTSPLDDDFTEAEAEAEAEDYSGEGDHEHEAGIEASVAERQPQRPRARQADYSQTRLEYPAAVMGNRPIDATPRVEPQFDSEPEMADDQEDEAAFDDYPEAATETAGLDEAQAGAASQAAEHYAEPASAAGPGGQIESNSEAPPEWHPENRGQHAASPIDRLRQEFIADARRARERAAEHALEAEAAVGSEPAPARSRLSVPGLSSLGAKARSGPAAKTQAASPATGPALENSHQKAPAAAKPAGRANVIVGEEATQSGSRFAMSRSKLLVGAVIVLFATAGALLMMRSPSQPIADAAPPVIEQTFDKATSGPQLSGPEDSAPAMRGEETPDRRGSLEGGRVYDGEFNYDVPAGDDVRPLASGLAGVAIADLDKSPNPAALAKAQRQQRLARMSSDLGAAAAYATPANLIAEPPALESAAAAPGSVARASDANHLDLPPATVGPLSLRLAAAKGDPSAQFEVAARLAGGTGTRQDLKGAVHWYQLAAAQGFAQAQYRLGTLYERGLGVDKDLARSGVWYERAAAKGNVKAMHNLAVVSAGREAGGPDYASAAKWFDAAAQYGLSDSQFNLAVLSENGLGVTKDLKRAYVNYALASAKGDEQAKTRRDAVRAMLSKDDVEAAERAVQAFRPKMADRIVNDARVAGEDWKKRADGGY